MSAEENKTLVRREIEEMFNHTGNLDAAEEIYAPDFIGHEPATPEGIHGVEGVKQFAASYRNAFPDLTCTIEDQLAEGDKVATRFRARGTQCLARDGHLCLSLAEKTIDDLLHAHGIPHEKEPRDPEGNYRADFEVHGTFVEYFGLKGDPDYDKKTRLKQKLCKKYGIRLVSIYPKDLVSSKKLEEKLLTNLCA